MNTSRRQMGSIELLPGHKQHVVRPLLDYLTNVGYPPDGEWQGWRINRIIGGGNNRIYRATNDQIDLAVKFTIRDSRDRAGREYAALLALRQARLPLAPEPILLDRTGYVQPVVVQTWLAGEVSTAPPSTEAEWQCLLQHMVTVHSVTPGNTEARLQEAYLNAYNLGDGRKIVRQQLTHIPLEAQPASLRALVQRLEGSDLVEWSAPSVSLCRADANISNFLRRPEGWASVDWEYSGWGDPAFDLANLMTHPAYLEVPSSRWDWAIDYYPWLVDDPVAAVRIRVYYKIMLVWWVARLARSLYEIPCGLDERLVARPADWRLDAERKYKHYLKLAEACGTDRCYE